MLKRVHLACHDGKVRDLPLSARAIRTASPVPTRTPALAAPFPVLCTRRRRAPRFLHLLRALGE